MVPAVQAPASPLSILGTVSSILEGSKITKGAGAQIRYHVIRLVEIIQKNEEINQLKRMKTAEHSGEVEQRLRIEESLVKIAEVRVAGLAQSFAEVARRGVVVSSRGVAVPAQIPSKTTPVVFIKDPEGSQENKEIKANLLASLEPA